MKVKELIAELKKMNGDRDVFCHSLMGTISPVVRIEEVVHDPCDVLISGYVIERKVLDPWLSKRVKNKTKED